MCLFLETAGEGSLGRSDRRRGFFRSGLLPVRLSHMTRSLFTSYIFSFCSHPPHFLTYPTKLINRFPSLVLNTQIKLPAPIITIFFALIHIDCIIRYYELR